MALRNYKEVKLVTSRNSFIKMKWNRYYEGLFHSQWVYKKSSCPEQIEFNTEDYFVQHMNVTTIYNYYN
jgi:hypothetical protein